MNIDHLVKMANQIGTFFESMPDRDQALQDIANHLIKFWDPRMRQQLLAHAEDTSAPNNDLTPIVRESITAYKPNLVRSGPGE